MKKVLVVILSIAMLASLLVGCQGGIGGRSKEVTLTVALNMDVQEAFEEFMRDFEENNPGVKIDLVAITPAIADFVQPAIASDTMPDALSVNSDSFSKSLADEGWLMDLRGSKAEELISPTVIPFFTSGSGIFYGLPYGVATILVYYNVDLFSELGLSVPTDWDSFIKVCETVKGHGVDPFSVAISDSAANTLWSSAFNNNIIAGNPNWETQMTDGSFVFDQPGIVDIFDKALLLADNGFLQEGAVGAQWMDALDAFNQGRAAMHIAGSWFATSIDGVADFKVGAFVPPFNDPGSSVYVAIAPETGWGGGGKTEHADEVLALLAHYVGDGRNILQNARGSIPVTKNTEGSELPPVVDSVLGSVMGSPNAGTLYFVYLPTVFQVDLQKMFQDVITGAVTPAQAAADMQPIYDAEFR